MFTGERGGIAFVVTMHRNVPDIDMNCLSYQFAPIWSVLEADGLHTEGWSSSFLERHSELLADR